jgi:hypothetical protein
MLHLLLVDVLQDSWAAASWSQRKKQLWQVNHHQPHSYCKLLPATRLPTLQLQ